MRIVLLVALWAACTVVVLAFVLVAPLSLGRLGLKALGIVNGNDVQVGLIIIIDRIIIICMLAIIYNK